MYNSSSCAVDLVSEVITTDKQVLVIDTETSGKNPHTAKLLGYSYCNGTEAKYASSVPDFIPNDLNVVCHNGKYDKIILDKIAPFNVYWDTMVAEYVLHIDQSVGLKETIKRRFKEPMKTLVEVYNEATGEKRVNLPEKWYYKVPPEVLSEYGKKDAENTYKLYLEQVKEFASKPDLYSWFAEVESPLVNILAEMELRGVKVDKDALLRLKTELEGKQVNLKHRLLCMAGDKELNLNSGKQIGEVLYTKLKLPILGKTEKGAPSTDLKVLSKLARRHLFPRLLLDYRVNEKILTTYTDSLVAQLDSNSRLHTNYNQCLTYTRRLSSDSPNLQNIPSKGEYGLRIKQCFIPSEGNKFYIYDYDQVELRLLAHFSQDPVLLKAFKEEQDLHQLTADLVGAKLGREFPRANGKTLNFSLLYGKSAYGFSKDWNCSRQEAEEIIAIYFSQYPGVRDFMYAQVKKCKMSGGWLKSLAGLPLYVENINSQDRNLEDHARRCAVNYVIQASSQDIIKKAIVEVKSILGFVPVLTVHDELVYDENRLLIEDGDRIKTIMENSFKLDVPVKVTAKIADRWEK